MLGTTGANGDGTISGSINVASGTGFVVVCGDGLGGVGNGGSGGGMVLGMLSSLGISVGADVMQTFGVRHGWA